MKYLSLTASAWIANLHNHIFSAERSLMGPHLNAPRDQEDVVPSRRIAPTISFVSVATNRPGN